MLRILLARAKDVLGLLLEGCPACVCLGAGDHRCLNGVVFADCWSWAWNLEGALRGCGFLKGIAYLLIVSLLPKIVRGSEHCCDLMEIDQSIPLLCKGRNAHQTRKHVSGSQWWVSGGGHSCCPQLLS